MNARSIRFRLVAWYAGLTALVMLAFGALTYSQIGHYLRDVQAGHAGSPLPANRRAARGRGGG